MSNLIFLPAPWNIAVPDFVEEPPPQEELSAASPPTSFDFSSLKALPSRREDLYNHGVTGREESPPHGRGSGALGQAH